MSDDITCSNPGTLKASYSRSKRRIQGARKHILEWCLRWVLMATGIFLMQPTGPLPEVLLGLLNVIIASTGPWWAWYRAEPSDGDNT